MKAEERKKTEIYKWLDSHDPKSELIGLWAQADLMQQYAQHYHKTQVESITDEEINAKYPIMGDFNNAMWDLKQSSLRQGEKNFKQTLLKKIK